MILKLSLPEGKVVWALSHPISREYIHNEPGVGVQKPCLIINEGEEPKSVTLESYPKWAQSMIITSIAKKELINTGDTFEGMFKPKEKIQPQEETVLEVTEAKIEKASIKKKARKTNKKT